MSKRYTLLFATVALALATFVHGFALRDLMDAPDKSLSVHEEAAWGAQIPAAVMATHLAELFHGGANAHALKNGAPLPRPRSIVRCPSGGCNETLWKELEARKLKKRQAPSPLPTLLPARSGNFQSTCVSISYVVTSGTTSTVSARCYDQTGVLQSSSIVVDNCVANKAGSMVCSLPLNYYWGSTCRSCKMTGLIMSCSCNRGNGVYQTSTLDFSQCLGNNNGVLYCTNNG